MLDPAIDVTRSALAIYPSCGQPMHWKRTRRAFTSTGVTQATVYACEPCEQVIQIAEDGRRLL